MNKLKKVILLLFSGLGCLMFMGSVKALTFEKIIDVYKENVLNNEIFKESSDKISFTILKIVLQPMLIFLMKN